MTARFFLSYARADGTAACEFFETALKTLEHEVYRDLTGNHGGDIWQEKIRDQIRRADAFLLFLTPSALQSANVEKEWREALALRCLPDCAPRQTDASERRAAVNNVGRPGR